MAAGYIGKEDADGNADLTTGAWIAFFGSVASCVLILVFLDNTSSSAEPEEEKKENKEISRESVAVDPQEAEAEKQGFSLKESLAVLASPAVLCLVVIKTCGAMATGADHLSPPPCRPRAGAGRSFFVFVLPVAAVVFTSLLSLPASPAAPAGIWYAQFSGTIAKENFGIDTQMLGLVTSYSE
eukprot:SAG22_NODE_1915_length_3318_cov_6.926996_3_plen_183_part_00